MKINDVVELFASVAIIFAAAQIWVNRKQLFLSTIVKCVSDYRYFLGMEKDCQDVHKIIRYIDFCNEELFYFKHGYILNKIAYEWIDGMINYLPLRNSEGKILNQQHCLNYFLENSEALIKYPRVQWAFELRGRYNFDLVYDASPENHRRRQTERKRLISEIIRNNKRFEYF